MAIFQYAHIIFIIPILINFSIPDEVINKNLLVPLNPTITVDQLNAPRYYLFLSPIDLIFKNISIDQYNNGRRIL